MLQLNGTYLNLNGTSKNPVLIQLVVNKFARFTMPKPLKLVMNLSSIINLVPSTDLSKMSEQLDKLDDFARTNPVKALDILGDFVNAINSQADEEAANMTTTTTTTQAAVIDRTNEFAAVNINTNTTKNTCL